MSAPRLYYAIRYLQQHTKSPRVDVVAVSTSSAARDAWVENSSGRAAVYAAHPEVQYLRSRRSNENHWYDIDLGAQRFRVDLQHVGQYIRRNGKDC